MRTRLLSLALAGMVWTIMCAAASADVCDEPNDRPSGACRLAPGVLVDGFIEHSSDIDLYAVELVSGVELQVTMTPPGDFKLSLQALDGAILVPPSGQGREPRELRFTSPATRTYFIRVESTNGDASTVLPYSIQFQITGGTSASGGSMLTSVMPHDVVVRLDEAGREAKQEYLRDGMSPDGQWAETRFERPRTFRGMRSGWVSIISRATVAPDAATAQRLYREVASQEYPEASEPLGPDFDPNTGRVGDEYTARGSCQDTCVQEEPLMHVRIVFRKGQTVGVLYVWGMGGTESATGESAGWLARQMASRIP